MRNEEIPLRQILRAPERLQEMLQDLQRCDNDGKMGGEYLEAHGFQTKGEEQPMTNIIPSMASHFLFSIIQDQPDEVAGIIRTLTEKNPDEISQFLWSVSGLIAGYVRILEKVNPGQKRNNRKFCQVLKGFPIQEISEENVSYRR